jgi:hypothetical protein
MIKKWLISFCLIATVTSCNLIFERPEPSLDDPRIQRKAQQRLNTYISQKVSTCRNRINADAENHVDSTITKIISKYLNDTMYFPPIPERPELPPRLALDTSLVPVPIFKDSLN